MPSTVARIKVIPVISPVGSANDLDGAADTLIVKVFDQDGKFEFGEELSRESGFRYLEGERSRRPPWLYRHRVSERGGLPAIKVRLTAMAQ